MVKQFVIVLKLVSSEEKAIQRQPLLTLSVLAYISIGKNFTVFLLWHSKDGRLEEKETDL